MAAPRRIPHGLKVLSPRALSALADALVEDRIACGAGMSRLKSQAGLDEAEAYVVVRELLPFLQAEGIPMREAGWMIRGYAESVGGMPPAPELVWTGPGTPPSWLDLTETRQVMTEMLGGARSRILLAGYSLSGGAKRVVAGLSAAVQRGVRVRLVMDRMEEKLHAFNSMWPKDVDLPEILTFDSTDEAFSSFHAKTLACDGTDLLVTSANLSFRGLESNIEIGIRIRGPVAFQVEELFNYMETKRLLHRFRIKPGSRKTRGRGL